MAGSTNQIQTPFGTGVRTALQLAAMAAGGISEMPANPSVSVSGTLYGSLFTVWQGSTQTGAGTYSPGLMIGTYANYAANGAGATLPTITTINFGSIQVLNNAFSGTLATVTSITASSLVQISSDFNIIGAAVTTLSMPLLQYIGGVMNSTFNALTTWSFPALTTINANFGAISSGATTLSMPVLSMVNGAFAITFAGVTSIDFSGLQYIGQSFVLSAATLTTLSLPALITVTTTFQITAANLVTFSIGNTLKKIGGNFTMTGMKLNQASVDGILVSLAALDGTGGSTAYSGFTVNLSGGTSSAPGATGLTAKATLQGRGCTVTTN